MLHSGGRGSLSQVDYSSANRWQAGRHRQHGHRYHVAAL